MNQSLQLLLAAAMIAPDQVGPVQIDLKPAGKWRVDYADNGCVLSRPFSSVGREYNLALTFEPVSADVWMRLQSADPVSHRDHGDTKVTIDGANAAKPVHFNVFKNQSKGSIREYWLRDFDKTFAGTQRSLRLDTGRYGDIRFDFEGFREAMKSIGACMDDLHRSLGIDPALLKTIATSPKGFEAPFIDIPSFQDEFNYQMLYWVTPQGRVDECHLLAPTGKPNFDRNACEQLKKNGRFTPARNAAGQAIRAPVYQNAHLRKTVVRSN